MQFLFPFLLATTSTAYLLPHPQGKYNITLTHTFLTTPHHTLMLSIFHPASCASTISAAYMPPLTASYQSSFAQAIFNVSIDLAPILLDAQLPVCSESCATLVSDTPVLLFSPGYRGTRLFYSVLASAIASEGFTVVTIDHPTDTNIIEYPDGTTHYSNVTNANYDELAVYAESRAKDVSFILDHLFAMNTSSSFILPPSPNQPKVAIAGHSLGGATAILAAPRDTRISAAINLDGPYLSALPASNITQPVLTLASEHENYPSLIELWDYLGAAKLWVEAKGMTHEGMTDLPVLFDAAGMGGVLGSAFGKIGAREGVEIMSAYTVGWMKGVFEGVWDGVVVEGRGGVEVVRSDGFQK
jgi:dienelactone hydrolase